MSILSNYSDEEFTKIVNESISYKDCLYQLGYNSYSGSVVNLIKNRIKELNLSIEHFRPNTLVERTIENVFCENSTANQTTLRRWYKEGNYTAYKCAICGLEPFWNGKELTLILDHKNGINHDDRLENLRWVCPNCNYQLDTTNGKNKKRKEHQINYCIDCGIPISKNSTRCLKCSNKNKSITKELPVTREELKKLIRIMPFTQIGQKFNVSDNAIRKWCDKYNLPRKSSEIKKISNDEWANI